MNRAVQKLMPRQQQTTTLARSHGRLSPNTSRKVQCWQSGLALGTCVKQSAIWKEGEEGSHGAQPQSTHSLPILGEYELYSGKMLLNFPTEFPGYENILLRGGRR